MKTSGWPRLRDWRASYSFSHGGVPPAFLNRHARRPISGRCRSTTRFGARPAGTRAPTGLREDEEFVIKAVANAFSGTWQPGEDPPDAYLTVGTEVIAVEISTLTQHVTDNEGTRPRLSDDIPTARLADALNDELQNEIPDGHTIGLVLSSPIIKPLKTKIALAKIIRGHLTDLNGLVPERKIDINGNFYYDLPQSPRRHAIQKGVRGVHEPHLQS
jgi:hypothetical protein